MRKELLFILIFPIGIFVQAQSSFDCDPSLMLSNEERELVLEWFGDCATSIHELDQQTSCEPHLQLNEIECLLARLAYNYTNSKDKQFFVDSSCVDDLVEKVYQEFGVDNLIYPYVLNKRGAIAYYGFDDSRAIHYYQKSLQLQLKQNRGKINYGIARAYVNMANSYYYLDSVKALIACHTKVESFFAKSERHNLYPKLYVDFLRSKADYFLEYDDLDNLILTYKRIISYQRTTDVQQCNEFIVTSSISARNQLAHILATRLEQYTAADSLAKEARSMLDELGERQKVSYSKYYLANYINQALSFTEQDSFEQALAYNTKALQLVDFFDDSFFDKINIYNNLAYSYILQANYTVAEAWLNKAQRLAEGEDIEGLNANLYDNFSDVELSKENYHKALSYNTRAIRELVKSEVQQIEDIDFADEETFISDLNLFIRLLASRASIYETIGNSPAALETYRQAATLIERMRLSFRPDASKGLLAKKAKPIFAAAIETCWQLYEQDKSLEYAEEALRFAEQSSSLTLYDAVSNAQAAALLPDSLRERDKELQLSLTYAEKQLAESDKDNNYDEIEKVDYLRRQLDGFRNKLAQAYPDYHDWVTKSLTKDFATLQERFQEKQCYLKYFTTVKGTYAFVINGNEKFTFLKLPNMASHLPGGGNHLHATIQEYLDRIKEQSRDWLDPAHRLYQNLVEPVIPYMQGEEVVIIPDGDLAYISFDLLPTRLPEDRDNYSYLYFTDYLLNEKIISYQYSLALDGREVANAPASMTNFLGIAPAFEEKLKLRGKDFSPLVKSEDLIQQLACAYGCKSGKWYDSNKAQFIAEAENFRIIQIASHAVANSEDGDSSYVLLGKDSANVLIVKEIYGMRMPHTDLLILTACEGADGALEDGEGVISLGRSFFYAGVRAVVSTLWEADEISTVFITKRFHEYLLAGEPKNKALNKARKDYLVEYVAAAYDDGNNPRYDDLAHPYYWAAFVPFGNMEPIDKLTATGGFCFSCDWQKVLMTFIFVLVVMVFLKWKKLFF